MIIIFETRDGRRGFLQWMRYMCRSGHKHFFSSFIVIFPANYWSSTYDTNFPTFWNLDAVIASDPPRDVLSP